MGCESPYARPEQVRVRDGVYNESLDDFSSTIESNLTFFLQKFVKDRSEYLGKGALDPVSPRLQISLGNALKTSHYSVDDTINPSVTQPPQ